MRSIAYARRPALKAGPRVGATQENVMSRRWHRMDAQPTQQRQEARMVMNVARVVHDHEEPFARVTGAQAPEGLAGCGFLGAVLCGPMAYASAALCSAITSTNAASMVRSGSGSGGEGHRHFALLPLDLAQNRGGGAGPRSSLNQKVHAEASIQFASVALSANREAPASAPGLRAGSRVPLLHLCG